MNIIYSVRLVGDCIYTLEEDMLCEICPGIMLYVSISKAQGVKLKSFDLKVQLRLECCSTCRPVVKQELKCDGVCVLMMLC